jgi:hypothetical protein
MSYDERFPENPAEKAEDVEISVKETVNITLAILYEGYRVFTPMEYDKAMAVASAIQKNAMFQEQESKSEVLVSRELHGEWYSFAIVDKFL